MLIWDFNVITAFVQTICLGVVIALWLFYTLNKGRQDKVSGRASFRQCGICGYLYFDYAAKPQGVCPRCGSYQA